MNGQKEDSGNAFFILVCLMIAVLFVLPTWYASRAGYINGTLLELAKTQIAAFAVFSDEAQQALGLMAQADPAALSWEQMTNVLRYSGKWIRWPYAVVLAALGVAAIFMERTAGLIRRLNMDSLLAHNAESFACLRPVVGRGKYLLSRESYDNGPWRIARTPVQFAVEHGLLLDKEGQAFTAEQVLRRGLPHADLPAYGHAYLDEEQAAIVLQEQLGKKFSGFDAMSQERKVLASAFLAYAAGDKHACMSLLDAMSVSYTENEKQAPACPVLENATFQKQMEDLWNTHKTLLDEPILKRHAVFELPLFMAMLTLARRKGVLASSQFLWLRPLDRPLWYALNQCGGRAAWAEGFAAWRRKKKPVLHSPKLALPMPCSASRIHWQRKAGLRKCPNFLNRQGFIWTKTWFSRRQKKTANMMPITIRIYCKSIEVNYDSTKGSWSGRQRSPRA